MGCTRWKRVSVKKLSVRKRSFEGLSAGKLAVKKRSGLKDSGFVCSDGLACSRQHESFDPFIKEVVRYGACWCCHEDGSVYDVCPRHTGKLPDASSVKEGIREASVREDAVHVLYEQIEREMDEEDEKLMEEVDRELSV